MSHFPALEDFDETPVGQPGATPIDLGLGDADDDFISRENKLLGDEARNFVTADDDNLLGGGEADPANQFTRNFPDMASFDNNEMIGPGGVITGTSEPYLPGHNTYSGMTLETEEEPEVIRQWRERQTLEIQRRDELSEARKRETIEKAQGAVDDFYENYNAKRDKAIEQTRFVKYHSKILGFFLDFRLIVRPMNSKEAQEFLDSRENMTSGGTAWERIAKLVDLTEKGARSGKSDKSRFREMLLSLKKDEKAPGASGF
ncbi:clathrin light chain [Morchella snyderi]|nr:clathrin light chain [Morchella snyderi]